MDMTKNIQQHIKTIASQRNIQVLLASETGSRAWGFPSPDSDYDVRLIYQHDIDWYLSFMEKKDNFDVMLANNEIDISAWELRKALRLLYKSNIAMIERIQSHIVYQQDNVFHEQINQLANACYSKIASMYHYLGLANNCIAKVDVDNPYKLKSFFYALRASTACLWILQRDDIPPMHFPTMLAGLSIKPDIVAKIHALIELKAKKSESYLHSGEAEIIDFMHHHLKVAGEHANQLSGIADKEATKAQINAFFASQIKP